MSTIEELEKYEYKPLERGYGGPTKYMDLDVPPWNHPTALAKEILSNVEHWVIAGMQVNAPMGHGKTTFATVIAHHIHRERPEFNIVWAGASEFKNIERFFESLPKCQPVVIIFDDMTSALKSMSDKDLHRNFNALTRVRHIIDPEKGKTPIVIITTGHYSKNLEKEYRNVLVYNGFTAWTNDEETNIETIAPKDTQARLEVRKFTKIITKISQGPKEEKKFTLRLGNGTPLDFIYDKPFRPACVVHNIQAKIILYDERDVCQLCSKKKVIKIVPAIEVYNKIKTAWGPSGIQALRLCLWRRGYYKALPRRVATASEFIEERLLSEVSTDFDELLAVTYKQNRKAEPKQLYHKRKEENQMMEELQDVAVTIPVEPSSDIQDEFDLEL